MALTRVSRHIIDEPLELQNINATGIGTFASLRVTGDLQVDGTTTTLDTVVTEVDRLEVSANNSTVGAAITQTGSGDILRLFDGASEVFSVADGGRISVGSIGSLVAAPLHIKGEYLDQSPVAGIGSGSFVVSNSDPRYGINFGVKQNGTGWIQQTRTEGSATNYPLLLNPLGGNIGIGIDNPGQELHVQAGTGLESDIRISGNGGASSYLDLYHNATNCGIWNAGNTDLLFGTSGTERLRITSDGKVRVPDNGKFVAGAGDDLQIYHNTSHGLIENNTGSLYLFNYADDHDIILLSDNGSGGTNTYIMCDGSENTTKLYASGSIKLRTVSTGVEVTGNINPTGYIQIDDSSSGGNLYIGNSSDLKLFHNGTNSYIRSGASNAPIHFDNNSGVLGAKFVPAGAFELYHNGNKRVETTNTGASVTGNLNISGHTYLNDNRELVIGAGNDLKLYHNATDSYIDNATGDFYIRANGDDMILRAADNISIMPQNGENGINVYGDGPVDLYYDNVHKFQTTATGAKVLGSLEVTQEYPSIRPTLDLNFAATKTLDRRITFTRDSVGTYTDENGLVKYASNNVPRFDHDPTTGESLGLLIEESRTNLAEYGTIVGGTGWYNRPAYTTTLNDSVAPDGRTTATKITNLNAESDADLYSYEQYSIGSNKTITHSIYIKSPDTANVGKEIHFRGKRIGGTSSSWSQKFILTAEWQRVTITHTYQSDNSTGRAYIGSDPNSNNPAGEATACLFWGLQVEEGSFATSFIPTYGSTVTRAADITTIKGTNFTDFYNQTEGTAFIHALMPNSVGAAGLPAYAFKTSTNSNYNLGFSRDNTGAYHYIRTSDANTYVYESLVNEYRAVLGIKTNDLNSYINDANQNVNLSTITLFDADILYLGYITASNVLNGHIKRFSYYPKRLPDAQLQGLTQQ